MDDAPLLTVLEAERFLKISRTRIFQLIKNDELKSVQVGKKRLISRDSCVEWAGKLFAQ